MSLYFFVLFIPSVFGQLFLGPCPKTPAFIKDPDFERYSGKWYVLAQSPSHPLKAANCQTVMYTKHNVGLYANFSYLNNYPEQKTSVHAKLLQERDKKSPGELQLKFENFPRIFQFRILHTNYTDVAVEYMCLPGVFNYLAHLTILHRKASHEEDLNTVVKHLNLTEQVTSGFRENMQLVNHENCK